jgi:hypothetical protein
MMGDPLVTTFPQIECGACEHYYRSPDRSYPHGCRAIGFRSEEMPSQFVFESSGIPCCLFEAAVAVTC